MSEAGSTGAVSKGSAALCLMEDALALLDEWDQALGVGAQLDLAICRLRAVLGLAPAEMPKADALCDPDPWAPGAATRAA
jgi:hypothetical protein